MLMADLASKRNIFIVQGLGPDFVLPGKFNGFEKILRDIHINTDARKRGVPC